MSKETVLNRLAQEWDSFLQACQGLSDADLREPNVVGIWSIRDVLAHISTWEEETMRTIPLILKGQSIPRYASQGGIDAFNAREQAKKQHLNLHQVQEQLSMIHDQLIQFLSEIPEDKFVSNKRLLHRIRLDTYNHYHEHAQQIQDWRRRTGRL